MRLGKRLFKSPATQQVLAWLAGSYFFLVKYTTRWQVEIPLKTQEILAARGAYIGCFWHGRMAMAPAAMPKGRPFYMLVSGHRDGALVGRGIGLLGISTVSGSSRRGGAEAMRSMQRILSDGEAVGITPDGPRGPRMRVKAGAIKIAQLSGMPVLPVSAAIRPRRLLKSWDRFFLPMPFCRGIIIWGEPINVPRRLGEDKQEAFRRQLEDSMNALTLEADRRCGLVPVEPAPLESPKPAGEYESA